MICPECRTANEESARRCEECGAALTPVGPGTLIHSRYEILEILGKGGMGVVYKAHDRLLDEVVALKLIRSDLTLTADVGRRFRSEIRLARRVTHRNVCRINEYGEDGPLRYIAMGFIDGVDVKQLIREKGPLPPADAYEIAIAVAEALQAIHEEGILHRDLKTPNVMRDRRGVVKLMDFGIAKPLEEQSGGGLTATGAIVGTPEYMSPEQARGEDVDFRSDVYSLAVVVFELFTGALPFKGDTPIATILKLLQQPPPLAGAPAARIPPALLPVLRKGLAKDREERHQTAAEMAEALRQARTAGGVMPVQDAVPRTKGSLVASAAALPAAQAAPTPVPTPVPTSAPTFVPTEELRPSLGAARHARSPAVWALVGTGMAGALAAGGVLVWNLSWGSLESGPSPRPAVPPAAAAPVPSFEPQGSDPPRPLATPDPRRSARPVSVAQTPERRGASGTVAPAPGSVPSATAIPVARGFLRVTAIPWADVTVDGAAFPTLRAVPLPAGSHLVQVVHPDYEPVQRRVTVVARETTHLTVDLPEEAVRKKR